jgi:hypothetical protein
MGDMIDRDAAIAKCRAIADEAKSYGMPQMAMGGYASAEAIAALPAAPAEDVRAGALRKILDDVVCGRGMFGNDAEADLKWAMQMCEQALALIPEAKP